VIKSYYRLILLVIYELRLRSAVHRLSISHNGPERSWNADKYGTSPGAVIAGSVNAFVTNTVATTLASTTITGTVAVTQSTSPWVVSGTVTTTPPANASTNITQWDSTALGAPSAYGTSPGAVTVPGVNAFITNTVATTLASTTITGTVAVTQSTSPWVDNLTQVAGVALEQLL